MFTFSLPNGMFSYLTPYFADNPQDTISIGNYFLTRLEQLGVKVCMT